MRSLQRFVLALALYIALVINASLALYLHEFFSLGSSTNLLLSIGIMLIALFDDTNKNEIWLALGAGIISDIYFYGIIGIYAVALPTTCWLLQKVARFLPEVFWARMLVIIIAVVGVNAYSWLILKITGVINVSVLDLLWSVPTTIGWSFLFACLTYKIWSRLAIKYPFLVNLNNYQ
ncbi:rod shape-determining protein MreD [Lactobacillus bombicola]|uniref:Rod shape-determining protein MreD n=1 Tax=Lactobacillus bombicola TaxID=1505723 RepID=A0A396SR92_9LACO|nr:rod shape-determining protein MreD [Lactobacillus bombicola]RHW53068.1 rod shape-determining protein MreD [Lactobacillus bombicola]RHW54528.1 rod shape-determining protein MreD [Lactobacillus bombicola]